MRLDEFDYHLPEELIALRPARPRPASRLLVAGPAEMHDSQVERLGDWLHPGDLLVLHDPRVIPARLTARRPGAVAAPTASLHFDDGLLADLAARGVATTRLTLHVGAGTFLPVKAETVEAHRMHAEWGEIGERAVEAIRATRAAGGRVIPVGTTALRLIETAAATGEIRPWTGETDIFIRPGYRFRAADGLMTNFHLPKSTLLMLVSALMGIERIRAIYAHAIAARYRFFSYGDSSLLLPGGATTRR